MKRIFALVLILVTFFMVDVTTAQERVTEGIVMSIDPFVLIEDVDGETWALEKECGYEVGDIVIVTFDDMNSIYLYDDEIIAVTIR